MATNKQQMEPIYNSREHLEKVIAKIKDDLKFLQQKIDECKMENDIISARNYEVSLEKYNVWLSMFTRELAQDRD